MSSAVLKTRSLSTVLVGRPIKRQRQPLAGRVIQVEVIDRFLFAYFCEASSANTACGNIVSCIKGIKCGHTGGRQGASGEPDRRLQLVPEHTAGGRRHKSTGFIGRFSRLMPAVNCAVISDLVQNGVLYFVKIRPAVTHTIRPEADFTG